MAYTTMVCRLFYAYYGFMAFMFLTRPEEQMKMFELAGPFDAITKNMAQWNGAGVFSLSMVFVAAAQLDFKAQRKILQYHTLGMFVNMWLAEQHQELLTQKGQDMHIGRYLCAAFAALSILPCYVGVSEKDKEE